MNNSSHTLPGDPAVGDDVASTSGTSLSDGQVTARFSSSGSLVSLRSEATRWDAIAHEGLGLGFRLLVPLPGRRNNSVRAEDQDAPSTTTGQDWVQFSWETVRSAHGGEHAIAVIQRWELHEAQLIVRTHVRNGSELVVENVFAPYVGGLRPGPEDHTLTAIRHDYGSGMRQSMWPTFENSVGYYGVDVPTQLADQWMAAYGTPAVPYTLIQADTQGLYVGVAEPTTELVAWHAELWPGYADSLQASVPLDDTIADVPVRIQFAAVHVPYVMPGETRDLVPVMLAFYRGDWHDGADVYTRWRNSWLRPATGPDWVREPHTWQQIQINSPEDELRLQFDQLVEVGREAVDAGVTAIQLVGFNTGGQDRGNPSHEPDPRLGGREALKRAIAQIQDLGVKVVLFAKFNWADRSTQEFRDTWIHEAVKDPYGDYYMHPGYRYETVTQVLDINTRRLIPMCFQSERYLQECERQFDILVDLGADGILYDECLHHLPTLLCFETDHGHRYGAPTYANDRELIRRLRARVPDPETFLFAGEAIYDLEFEAYALSYHRSENRDHLPLHRYTAAREQMMTAATGFDDRNMVNQAFLYRYVVSYEPYNFKGRLTDFPQTVAYGRRMDTLRRETRRWTWDGQFTDTRGAEVEFDATDGTNPYSVFRGDDGSRAVCIANYDASPRLASVRIEGYDGPLVGRAIDADEWRTLDGNRITLAARTAAIVVPADTV